MTVTGICARDIRPVINAAQHSYRTRLTASQMIPFSFFFVRGSRKTAAIHAAQDIIYIVEAMILIIYPFASSTAPQIIAATPKILRFVIVSPSSL